VVAVATYLLLQLALVAFDLANTTTTDAVASAAAAFAALLLGGITAGATAMWRGTDDGPLHGIVWAVGLVALVVLAAAESGIALGSIGDVNKAVDDLQTLDASERVEANQDARDAAGRALGGVAGALAASAIGGMIGAKVWPRRRDDDVDLRDDVTVARY
jgi:hypothetical protein